MEGQLAPYVDDLASKPGGVLLLAVTIEPTRQNYPDVAFAVFDAAERAALRRALEAARKRRIKLMQDTKPIDPGTGEPIPNPKPDPNLPDNWPPKPPRPMPRP